MNISGKLLDAFLALEETQRFSLAAERCHVSASALSQMISRLEEQVGFKLFDRNTRNVSLTPEGEIFSIGVHRIASEMVNMVNEVKSRSSKNQGKVTIASPPSLAALWLPKQLVEFQSQFPGVTLRLHDKVADDCLEMIAKGEVDFGLNAHLKYEIEFEKTLLMEEPLMLICKKTHPLAKKTSVTLRDLEHQPFIYTSKEGSVRRQVDHLLKDLEIVDSGFVAAQLITITGLVANGFGISIVPKSTLSLNIQPEIVGKPIANPDCIRPVYLVKKRHRSLSFAAQALWDLLLFNASEILENKSPLA